MKLFLLSLFTLGLGCIVSAQTSAVQYSTTPPDAAAKPVATASTTTPDDARYQANPAVLMPCQKRLSAINSKPCDIIFIGDSITEGWAGPGKELWEKNYAPRNAFNFGVSGDKTQNVLWRLNNMELQSLKPKVAVILIGTNNTGNTAHDISDGVKAVIANTQSTFPGVKIILVSIMPNERAQDLMKQADSMIKHHADDSNVYYLDLVPLMPSVVTTAADGTTDSNWKGLSKDRLHPDASGYQIWADAMEPLLTKLLAGK